MNISFIIPVFNEEKIVAQQLTKFIRFLKDNKIDNYEILPVENGSKDKTWEIIKKVGSKSKIIRPLRINESSYGRAARHGLASAIGKKLFLMDIDFLNQKFFLKAVKELNKFDIVIGSKNHPLSVDNRPFFDRTRTKVLNKILRTFFNYKGTDTHGIRSFKNTPFLKNNILKCYCKYELFDTELLLRLIRQNQTLKEIPVSIREIRPTRYTSFRRMRLVIIDLYRLISFKLLSPRKYPKTVTADDYGLSSIVSSAIIDQYKANNINVISIISNLISKKDTKLLLDNTSQKDLSLHVNLLRGKPLSNPFEVSTLIKKNGYFYNLPQLLLRLILKKIDLNQIEFEIEKQLKHLKLLGINPSYIDSEQHTHIFTPIQSIVCKFAKKNNLIVRNSESTFTYLKYRFPKHQIVLILSLVLNLIYKKENNDHKNYYSQIVHPGSNFD